MLSLHCIPETNITCQLYLSPLSSKPRSSGTVGGGRRAEASPCKTPPLLVLSTVAVISETPVHKPSGVPDLLGNHIESCLPYPPHVTRNLKTSLSILWSHSSLLVEYRQESLLIPSVDYWTEYKLKGV